MAEDVKNDEEIAESEVLAEKEPEEMKIKKDEYASMQKQLADLTQQVAIAQTIAIKEKNRSEELGNLVNRTQADFDNYRRRSVETAKHLKEDGIAAVIEKIVPALDVIKQAIGMITDDKVAEGVKMIYRQLDDLLKSFGVTEIPSLGEQFDPNLHNAIMSETADSEEKINTVVEVFQSGYRLGDRIIRHSVVKVAN